MAKDPICGMEVQEEDAQYLLHYEHETIYFCSDHCRETYVHQTGDNSGAQKKGMMRKFLERLAKVNAQEYGGKAPKCH